MNKGDMNAAIQKLERVAFMRKCEITSLRKQLENAKSTATFRWMLLHRFELYRNSKFFVRRWLAAVVEWLVYGRIPAEIRASYKHDRKDKKHDR